MADVNFTVLEYTRPRLKYHLTDFRNGNDPRADVDISSYEFDLIVKRDVTDADSSAYIWLEGTFGEEEDWEDGVIWFELTEEHTSLVPGTYSGHIVWWKDGGTDKGPNDGQSVSFTVDPSFNTLPMNS